MLLWRISNHADLNGEGGLLAGGRWHHRGRRIVYLAESPAGALLEGLVHLELGYTRLPPRYTLLRIAAPPEMALPECSVVPGVGLDRTRAAGDAWLAAASSALLRVPSVLVPCTWNTLLNPRHPDAGQLRVLEVLTFPLDHRLDARGRARRRRG